MTLIETMIVVVLIALLTGTLMFGSGVLGGANRRAAASLVVAGVRKGLAHANATGKPVRLAIHINEGRLVLEEASSTKVLRRDPNHEEKKDFDLGASILADAEAAAEAILSGGGGPKVSFSAVDVLGQDGDSPGRDLGSGIKVALVRTQNDPEPLTQGTAYLHFWPGGVTERAVIQVMKRGDDSDEGLTVEVSALTGRATIKRGLIDLPDAVFDEDEEFSEREP